MGKGSFLLLILALNIALLGAGCAPGLRPNSNAFLSDPSSEGTGITLTDRIAPIETGPALTERASHITYGEWDKEKVDPLFSKSITNVYVAALDWDEAQNTFRLPVLLSLQEPGKKSVTALEFSMMFKQTPRTGGKAIEAISKDSKYSLNMICASDDCGEKILRLKRKSDGALAIIKNIRAEQVLVSANDKDNSEGTPVVQHYTEVKDGRVRREMTDREGGTRNLEPYVKHPELLKKFKAKKAIDMPAFTDAIAPGISTKTPGEKLVWIGELFIREKTIRSTACNKFVLFNLAASGYKIDSEPEAHNFRSVFLDSQFKGWHNELYSAAQLPNLSQRLMALPERRGVILQYSRGSARYGHVAIVFREGKKLYSLDASLNDHLPLKRARTVSSLMVGRKSVTVIIPPDIK